MEDLISIIVPIYNAEKYISRCIDSLLNQTYKNIEIILINDGSQDNTYDIIKEYEAKYDFIFCIHTENKGVSHARNLGMKKAKGRYITFVDADDALFSDGLEKLFNLMTKCNPDVAIGTGIRLKDDKESILYKESNQISLWEEDTIMVYLLNNHSSSQSVCRKLYKKEALDNIFFEEGRKVNEDVFFIFECFRNCKKIAYQDIMVYKCYLTPDSASRSEFSEKYFDILYFADKKIEIINKNYPQFKKKIPEVKMRANLSLLMLLRKTYKKKYLCYQKECLKTIRALIKEFTPKNRFEKRAIFIVKYRFFWLYKLYYHIKKCVIE